jgi:hypothetical protein
MITPPKNGDQLPNYGTDLPMTWQKERIARPPTRRLPSPESAEYGSHRLVCEECDNESPPDALGWRGYLHAEEDGSVDGVGMFCPERAEREFGD